ncbi:MAG: protein translocase subunit SecF [Clostridiales bacterium]|nr:protein translocase subunit SecF [Clostridiales bacterium]
MKSNKIAKKFKEKLENFSFTSKLKICSIISSVLIIAGILIVSIFGFNLGIDFVGGTVLNVKVGSVLEQGNNYNIVSSQLTNIVENNGFKVGYIQQEGVGEESTIIVRFVDKTNLTEEQMQEEIDNLKTEIQSGLSLNNETLNVEISNGSRIAATASRSLLINSILAILIAVILILIYIAIRFELLSGLTAILMLIHDVLIMCALVAVFRIQINAGFIAALITIIGYSINNVIIVFDRIRENKKKEAYSNATPNELANISIKQVLSRTILTALTTIVAILALTILGVASIKEFLLPILFGLLSGIYSSVMLAGPVWAFISSKTTRKAKDKTEVNK